MFKYFVSKIKTEYIVLILFTILFLLFGPANLFNNTISHHFPHGYLAADSFVHQMNAEALKDIGNSDLMPFWRTGSLKYKTSPVYTPPLSLHLSVLLSETSGIEVYDTVYLQNFLFVLFSILALYLILKRFNKQVALYSLPITFLLFTNKFLSGFTWGQWDMYTGVVFLIASLYVLLNKNLKFWPILLAIFVSAAFMSHVVEAIWAVGFIIIYTLVQLLNKTLNWKTIKCLFLSGLISIMFTFNFLIIFLYLWLPGRKDQITHLVGRSVDSFGYPVPLFNDFGWLTIILIVGVVITIFLIRKKNNIAFLFSIYMFLAGFSFYIGFDKGAQTRMLWPLYLMPLFGVVLYFVFKKILKLKNIWKTLIPLVPIFLIFFVLEKPGSNQGIVSPELWDQITFINENVPDNKIVYYFYGDRYSQWSVLLNSKKTTILANTNDLIESLKNNRIKENYKIFVVGGGNSVGFERTSLFKFEKIDSEEENKGNPISPSLCNFDYFVFDKLSVNPPLVQYNMAIRNKLMENDWFEEVYSNNYYSILKNNNPGVKCVKE